jgi:hypothetical protein
VTVEVTVGVPEADIATGVELDVTLVETTQPDPAGGTTPIAFGAYRPG